MDEVLLVIAEKGKVGTLRFDLLTLIGSCLTNNNSRGFKYMMHYYGLNGSAGLTLEAIGTEIAGGLTRERVRQIIDGALNVLIRAENGLNAVSQPYKNAHKLFDEMLLSTEQKFLRLSEFVEKNYMDGFGVDPKGLIAFLNDAGIKQVVYRGSHYIYPKTIDRRDAIELVQVENKKCRRAKTVNKMGQMAKTVTYVPQETREFLLKESKLRDIPLNRLYEKILTSFITKSPCKNSEDYEKTQSWRARKGKAEWSQVGIYIEKQIFDEVKVAAAKVKPEQVSNMSYICQAFVCFSKGLIKL